MMNSLMVGTQWQSELMEFSTEFMRLFIGEVFIIEICYNEPAVNQNCPAME
jgi:hypothetical protein